MDASQKVVGICWKRPICWKWLEQQGTGMWVKLARTERSLPAQNTSLPTVVQINFPTYEDSSELRNLRLFLPTTPFPSCLRSGWAAKKTSNGSTVVHVGRRESFGPSRLPSLLVSVSQEKIGSGTVKWAQKEDPSSSSVVALISRTLTDCPRAQGSDITASCDIVSSLLGFPWRKDARCGHFVHPVPSP